MIDIHCHILPGLDDGPKDMKTALKMAKIAAKDGVGKIVATPHCYDGVYDCQNSDIQGRCEEFRHALAVNNIDIEIIPAGEMRLVPEIMELARQDLLPLWGEGKRNLLLELPETFLPEATAGLIRELHTQGVRCIVAHPERNATIVARQELLDDFVRAGAELQVTAASLTGLFGRKTKLLARWIVCSGLSCHLATDGHNDKKRKPILSKGLKVANRTIGTAGQMDLFPMGCRYGYKESGTLVTC